MSQSDHDGLTPTLDEDKRGRAGLAPTDPDSQIDWEFDGLRSVMEMLVRVGPRLALAAAGSNGSTKEADLTGSLGDFSLVRVIGRGGMGVVYEAVQKSLNRRVALKILPAACADDPRKIQRFLIEAQAAASLRHPHIVPVHLVAVENGLHFYAMQYVEGRTLAEHIAFLRPGRRATNSDALPTDSELASPRTAAVLGRQAALALHFAHQQGIIHRDIKPSNLLIDQSGSLWVSDFGLARIAGQADLTLSGAVLGTLRYMSPEQAAGSRAIVDHRTDIYSLGASLYELLVLGPAFDGFDHLDMLQKVTQVEPICPRRINPAIPADLETIVLKAMSKEPKERYRTAQELADDLGRFLENRPIRARPPAAIDHVAKWVRRHTLASTATAFVLLLVLMGLAGATRWRDRMLRQHQSELSSARNRAQERELAARRPWYDSQIRLAQQNYAAGQLDAADQTLEKLRPESAGRHLRGFEWYYLQRRCHLTYSVLASHNSLATAIAVSGDGRTLVTGHADGVLVFCDLALGREFAHIVTGDGRLISNLWFSPDSLVLASTCCKAPEPNQVTLWNPTTARPFAEIPQVNGHVPYGAFTAEGNRLLLLEHNLNADDQKNMLVFWDLTRGPENPVPGVAPIASSRMAYPSNGRWMATSHVRNMVTLRDTRTGKPITTLSRSFDWISELAASDDGQILAVADLRSITIWDIAANRELGTVALDKPGPLTFSPDGNRLASADSARTQNIALIADVRTHARIVPLEGGANAQKIAYSPDGRMIATRGTSGTATIWDTTSGRTLARFGREIGRVGCVAFTPDGETLIVPGADGPICAWQIATPIEPVTEVTGHNDEVWGVAYTPDSKTLISASNDNSIKLWDARTGQLKSTLNGHTELVASVEVSRDGTRLASASFDNDVRLWDLPSGRSRVVLRGHTARVRAVAFSPDGRLVASAGNDKTVRIWDAESGEPIHVFDGHTDVIHALAFCPTGTLVVSASNDRTIRGINLSGGEQAFSLPCPEQNSAVAFCPDGSILATGDNRGNLMIWDTATWSSPISVKASETPIWALSFSPDGRTLAAAYGDAKVRLWDPATGQVMLELDGHTQRVNAVAFAADGTALASASHDGAIRLWHGKRP